MASDAPVPAPWWKRPSALVLIAANLVPVGGVLFRSWSPERVVLLSWIESALMGLFTVAKLLAHGALASPTPGRARSRMARMAGAIFLSGLFVWVYGGWCLVHGAFVLVVCRIPVRHEIRGPMDAVLGQIHGEQAYAALALFVSHGVSLLWNFLIRREYELVTAQEIICAPIGRIFILQFAILLGMMFVFALGSSMVVLLVLIAGKTLLDLYLHLKEREKGVIRLIPPRAEVRVKS